MMIEVAYASALCERTIERRRIRFHRDVEHRQLIARRGFDTFEQTDLALHARDEFARARVSETQLVERADAIRVAVENVVRFRHGFTPGDAARTEIAAANASGVFARASLPARHCVCQLAAVRRLVDSARGNP